MPFKRLLLLLFVTLPIAAQLNKLTLAEALAMLDKNNLAIKIAQYEAQMKKYDKIAAVGHQFGKLDLTVSAMKSNDAGNVFGFKLQSREAEFGDFGFSEFLPCMSATPPAYCANILEREPVDLNHPEAREHYLAKVTYTLPIYTGGKLTEYKNITELLYKMSRLDTAKVRSQKRYQVRKAFYDIALIQNYIVSLRTIIHNIRRLRATVLEMQREGYAQETDALEVKARLSEAQSMLAQARLNRTLAYQFLSFLLDKEVESIRYPKGLAPRPKVTAEMIERRSIDIQKAKLGLQVANRAVRVEQANFHPMIGAFAEYGAADNEVDENFFDDDFYTVGVQATVNLFNGGTDLANLEKARVQRLKVHEQVRLAKKGIALKVKKLETEISGLDAQISSHYQQLRFARAVYRKYRAKYKEGIASINDVLIKQAKELEMLLKLLTVKNQRNSKVFELQSVLNIGVKR